MSPDWRLPPSLLAQLERVPTGAPAALLIRHSVRNSLPAGDVGYTLPITEAGERLAQDLGAKLGERLATLHTSPLSRCVQTAEALRRGAGVSVEIVEDRLLGDPGVFVVDGARAWRSWEARGREGVMEHLVSREEALPGMARPNHAARFLAHHMLSVAAGAPGLHLFVTHDSLVTATAAQLIGEPLTSAEWPWYLEATLLWQSSGEISVSYRDYSTSLEGPLCGLSEEDAVELARREIARTVGLESGARFFLAGGAFKTLLTGRPPRDLDLWAPTAEDRELLLQALSARGATSLPLRPFADALSIHDRVVEVPHEVGPPTLEDRLARFDIALSAVGVEHQPGDQWRAALHPLALESSRRREILLLKPLANWKYALTTLERARRYADELEFTLPQGEEDEIWRVFSEQKPEMQRGMLERYRRSGSGGYGVLEDLRFRQP